MAVTNSNAKGAVALVETVDEEIIVDINDTSLADGELQEIDVKEDWQARACPPPKGTYRLKLYPGDKPEEFRENHKPGYAKDDPKRVYYTKMPLIKILDPGGVWDNAVVNFTASSGVPRGKKMSTMAGLMVMGRIKLPQSMDDKKVAQTFLKWLRTEPILSANCDWSAWDGEDKDARNKFGKRLLEGMLNFPKLADGKGHQHILKGRKGNEVAATLKVVKWVSQSAASLPKTAQVAQGLKPVVAPAAKPTPPPPPPVEETQDLEGEQTEFDLTEDGEVVLEG